MPFLLRWLPGLMAAAALLSLGLWLFAGAPVSLEERKPDREAAGGGQDRAGCGDVFAGTLIPGTGKPAEWPGAWPGFRGPRRDGISREKTRLARSWPGGGPRRIWALEVGEGYAGAVVWSGRVYLHDYDRPGQKDAIRCLSLADGREIWRYAYPVPVKRNHGMSRTVPALSPKYLACLGPKCHVTCLDPVSGKRYWAKDLVKEFGTTVPPWYAGQCPLLEDGRVILAPAGKETLMIAVEAASGKVLWRAPNPRGWRMTHSSIVPMTLEGQRVYLYVASGGVVAVEAASGKILWDSTDWKIRIAAIPSPLAAGEGRVFFSGGYNAGSMMMRLRLEGGRLRSQVLFRLKANSFGATQQTPILYQGRIYGVRPNGELVCLDLQGKVRWSSGAENRFGLGPFLIADGLIFLLDDHGTLTMAEARPDAYRPLAQAKVLSGHDAWGPMALAGGRLLVRDLRHLVCLDVSAPRK